MLKPASEVKATAQLVFDTLAQKQLNAYIQKLSEVIETDSSNGLFDTYLVFTNVSYRTCTISAQPGAYITYDTSLSMQNYLSQVLNTALDDLGYVVKLNSVCESNHTTTYIHVSWKS